MNAKPLNVDTVSATVEMIARRYGGDAEIIEAVVRPLVAATDAEHVALAAAPSSEFLGAVATNATLIQSAAFDEELAPLGAPVVLVGERFWYLRRLARAEFRVAKALHHSREELATPLGGLTREEISVALEEIADDLATRGYESPELRSVVENMVFRSISFVTGGPGTGKTWIVAQAMRVVDRALSNRDDAFGRVSVGLSAPTGKASRRVSSSLTRALDGEGFRSLVRDTSREGSLHQLLGVRPDRMHSPAPLADEVTVVDEVSMADLVLLDLLITAAQREGQPPAHLVLVGDPNQLASVNVGAVLSDVVNPRAGLDGLVTHLTTTHRYQAGGSDAGTAMVGDLAVAIIDERVDDVDAMLASNGAFLHTVGTYDDAALGSMVLSHAREVVALASAGDAAGAQAALGRMTILSATRRGPGSVEWWNAFVDAGLGDNVERFGNFYVGQPVLVRKNQHALKVSNGDVGVVIGGEQPKVVFDEGREVPLFSLGYLSPAWAMTIHKSQGSEYDHVVVVLPNAGSQLLTRELFYTAVTRAKTEVTVVGSSEVLREAIGRSVERVSGLTDRLQFLQTASGE